MTDCCSLNLLETDPPLLRTGLCHEWTSAIAAQLSGSCLCLGFGCQHLYVCQSESVFSMKLLCSPSGLTGYVLWKDLSLLCIPGDCKLFSPNNMCWGLLFPMCQSITSWIQLVTVLPIVELSNMPQCCWQEIFTLCVSIDWVVVISGLGVL